MGTYLISKYVFVTKQKDQNWENEIYTYYISTQRILEELHGI